MWRPWYSPPPFPLQEDSVGVSYVLLYIAAAAVMYSLPYFVYYSDFTARRWVNFRLRKFDHAVCQAPIWPMMPLFTNNRDQKVGSNTCLLQCRSILKVKVLLASIIFNCRPFFCLFVFLPNLSKDDLINQHVKVLRNKKSGWWVALSLSAYLTARWRTMAILRCRVSSLLIFFF